MQRRSLVAICILLAAVASSSRALVLGAGRAEPLQRPDCNRPIANVTHDGIHFSVSIGEDGRSLQIIAPERGGGQPRPISIRLRFRDQSSTTGPPERLPSVSSGGYTDWRYRFEVNRPVTMSDIFSVTISVAGESFEVFPW
jgi:hypothetical protein